MKKASWLFLAVFSFFQTLSVMGNGEFEATLGIAQKVEGNVFLLSREGLDKKKLKTGDPILAEKTVLTEKKSRLLIRFNDGILKLVPENTKLSFIDKEWLEIYKKTDSSIEKISATLGTKASEKKIWFDDQENKEKNIEKLFQKKEYQELTALYEKNPSAFYAPQSLLKTGISYFKLGSHEKSKHCFQILQEKFSGRERESAYFALALLALRDNDQNKASRQLELLKKEFSESPLIEELNRLMALKENE